MHGNFIYQQETEASLSYGTFLIEIRQRIKHFRGTLAYVGTKKQLMPFNSNMFVATCLCKRTSSDRSRYALTANAPTHPTQPTNS
ncbi:hypothetical protein J6590_077931 [Homalodisca vitripennis]|nr:hypothetical protein J6590_077931 [Homalodisca vitripennis]